jgi:hypothetical protein
MCRTANWLLTGTLLLAVAASGCMTPPGSATGSSAAAVGTADSSEPAAYTPPSTTHPAPLKNAHVDQTQSQALTDYLKAHHLPLVGAQVLAAADGERQVILFGYVATDYGKGDAESKARRYVNNSAVTVDNRIKIEPSLAKSSGGSPESQPPQTGDMNGLADYQNQTYADQIQQQQMNSGGSYQNTSPMSVVIPLLGMFGGSIGGGGFGMGGGMVGPSFGGGYPMAPPPSYGGYPMAPPPSYPVYPSFPGP